ncbi:MAG: hypothetical protein K2P86_11790 [Xanthobacteraceae bacterium]|nr:hypothetical protein [Xanthobacteraceae bacterium]
MLLARILTCAILLGIFWPASAQARIKFGSDETIRFVANVKATGPGGERLFLAHKITTHFFLLGTSVSDDGYVLAIVGEGGKKYYRLPAGAELERLQAQGLLPHPLPPYSLNFFDYLFGYSLWIFIASIPFWASFLWFRKMRRNKSVEHS